MLPSTAIFGIYIDYKVGMKNTNHEHFDNNTLRLENMMGVSHCSLHRSTPYCTTRSTLRSKQKHFICF
jgi:hypothetical protein